MGAPKCKDCGTEYTQNKQGLWRCPVCTESKKPVRLQLSRGYMTLFVLIVLAVVIVGVTIWKTQEDRETARIKLETKKAETAIKKATVQADQKKKAEAKAKAIAAQKAKYAAIKKAAEARRLANEKRRAEQKKHYEEIRRKHLEEIRKRQEAYDLAEAQRKAEREAAKQRAIKLLKTKYRDAEKIEADVTKLLPPLELQEKVLKRRLVSAQEQLVVAEQRLKFEQTRYGNSGYSVDNRDTIARFARTVASKKFAVDTAQEKHLAVAKQISELTRRVQAAQRDKLSALYDLRNQYEVLDFPPPESEPEKPKQVETTKIYIMKSGARIGVHAVEENGESVILVTSTGRRIEVLKSDIAEVKER